MPAAYFKKCSRCGREWQTPTEYINGTIEIVRCDQFGLALRNCTCGTTLGCWADCLYDAEISPIAMQLRMRGQPMGSNCTACPDRGKCRSNCPLTVLRLYAMKNKACTLKEIPGISKEKKEDATGNTQ